MAEGPELGLAAIGRASLRDGAYAALRDALLAGRFAPGQKLIIRTLAAAFAISPTPVREALGRLHAERVLDLLPSGSAVIPPATRAGIAELAAVRAIVEGGAGELATARMTADDLIANQHHLGRLQMAHQRSDAAEFRAAQRDFAFQIYACTGNALLGDMIETLWLKAAPALSLLPPAVVLRRPQPPAQEQIHAALRRRDAAAVREAIARDIAATAQALAGLADSTGVIRPAPG
jgi:DNA-binding GntR family transcriptional regulator